MDRRNSHLPAVRTEFELTNTSLPGDFLQQHPYGKTFAENFREE